MKKVLITALVVLGLILAVSCSTNYTVKYMDGTTVYKTQTVPAGGLATEPVEPTKEGAVFGGWYKEAECINAYDFNTKVNSSFNLYAKWTVVPVTVYYTVTFETNGGAPVPAAQKVAKGEYAKVPEIYPVRAGFAFTGWYAEEECKTLFGFEKTPIVKDTTIYAGWKEIPVDSFSVTFNTNGGTPVPEVQIVKSGNLVVCPTTNPSKTGNNFMGWYSDAACTKVFDFNTTKITANTVIYAKWQQIVTPTVSTWIVSFDTREADTGKIADQVVNDGEAASMPVPAPSKTGYDFCFWATEAGEQYSFGTPVYSDIKLHAVWSEGVWANFTVLDDYITGITDEYKDTVKASGKMLIPDGIKGLSDGLRSSTNYAYLSDFVTDIELPASLEYVGNEAFLDFEILESIKVRRAPSTKGLKALDEDVNKRVVNINAKTLGKNIFKGATKVIDVYLSEVKAIGEGVFNGSFVKTLEGANVVSVDEKAFKVGSDVGTAPLTQLIVPSVKYASQIAGGKKLTGVTAGNLVLVVSSDAEPAYNFANTSTNVKTEDQGLVFNVYRKEDLAVPVTVDGAKIILCANLDEVDEMIDVTGAGVELVLGEYNIPNKSGTVKIQVKNGTVDADSKKYNGSLIVDVGTGAQLKNALEIGYNSGATGEKADDLIKIVLQDDVKVGTAITLGTGVAYTLDLNGHDISNAISDGFMFNVFTAKLIVVGKGRINASQNVAYVGDLRIANDGIFSIKGAASTTSGKYLYGITVGKDVELNAADAVACIQHDSNKCYGVAVDIYSEKITCGCELVEVVSEIDYLDPTADASCNAKVNIHDGVCVASTSNVLDPGGYAEYTIGEVTFVSCWETIRPYKCKITINGGTFVSAPKEASDAVHGVALALPVNTTSPPKAAKLTVKGGTFTGTKAISFESAANASVDVYGGTFNGEISKSTGGTLNIYGGTFSDLTGLPYCKDGTVYTLGKDCESTKKLNINTVANAYGVVVDLGGHTYTFNKGSGSVGSALTFSGIDLLNNVTKPQKITIKNGTINASKDNLTGGAGNVTGLLYNMGADLTIVDVKFDGSNLWGSGCVTFFDAGESYISETGSDKAGVKAKNGVKAVVVGGSDSDDPVLEIAGGTFGTVDRRSGTLEITGGTFANDVSDYVDKAYKTTKMSTSPETWTVTKRTASDPNEAMIGDSYYATFEDAAVAAKELAAVSGTPAGSVVMKLTNDVDFTVAKTGTERPYSEPTGQTYYEQVDLFDLTGVTLDLNGKTITSENYGVSYYGDDFTIRNGKFVAKDGGSYALVVSDLARDDEPEGVYGKPDSTGVLIEDVDCTGGINVYNAEVTIKEVTSGPGTIVAGTNYYAIWGDLDSEITVKSGTFTSASVETSYVVGVSSGTNGSYVNGKLTIDGGTFTAVSDKTIFDAGYAGNGIVVNGGTFSDLSGTKFCVDGAVYKLANDVAISAPVVLPVASSTASAIAIDLNGKTITGTNCKAFDLHSSNQAKLTLTLTNSASAEGVITVTGNSVGAVVTVNGGAFVVDQNVNVSSAVSVGINCNVGNIKIDGTVRASDDDIAVYVGGTQEAYGNATINGEVSSASSYGVSVGSKGILTVNGKVTGKTGIVTCSDKDMVMNSGAIVTSSGAGASDYALNNSGSGDIVISGGTVNGKITVGNNGGIKVDGGTFSSASIDVTSSNKSHILSRLNGINLTTSEESTKYSWTSAKDDEGYYHVGKVVTVAPYTKQYTGTGGTYVAEDDDAKNVNTSTGSVEWIEGDSFAVGTEGTKPWLTIKAGSKSGFTFVEDTSSVSYTGKHTTEATKYAYSVDSGANWTDIDATNKIVLANITHIKCIPTWVADEQ